MGDPMLESCCIDFIYSSFGTVAYLALFRVLDSRLLEIVTSKKSSKLLICILSLMGNPAGICSPLVNFLDMASDTFGIAALSICRSVSFSKGKLALVTNFSSFMLSVSFILPWLIIFFCCAVRAWMLSAIPAKDMVVSVLLIFVMLSPPIVFIIPTRLLMSDVLFREPLPSLLMVISCVISQLANASVETREISQLIFFIFFIIGFRRSSSRPFPSIERHPQCRSC